MARILGLDLGSHSVKAVVFESAIRGYVTKAYAEVKRGEGEPQEALRAVLRELRARPDLQADQVVVSLPGTSLATHPVSLPFNDPKRIDATIAFEVEGQLPFDLSEALFDYQVVGQKEKGSELLVGVVRREEMAVLLELLGEVKVDPRVVTHPALAYQNYYLQHPALLAKGEPAEAPVVAVVDIGHERTIVAIGRPGVGVELARTFTGGGVNLTRSLAAEFQISLPEAQNWKESYGAVGNAQMGGPDAERAAGALIRGLQPVLRELRPTLKAFTARTRRQVESVVLCGGTARMPGLAEQFSKDLGLPVSVLALPAEAQVSIPAPEQPAAAQAYALALRGQAAGARAPRFNLRRGEFAFKGGFDYIKDKLGLMASYVAALLLLLIASGVVRNSVLARREAKLDAVLCEVTQRVLNSCEKDYNRALSMLRGGESPAAGLPKVSAVQLLAELSTRMPAEAPITFDRIEVYLDRIVLRGETDSSKQIDTLSTALKGYHCFKDVKEGKVEKTKDGQKVTFRMDVQVQCPDDKDSGGEG
jgi:general secretion pathway protein L